MAGTGTAARNGVLLLAAGLVALAAWMLSGREGPAVPAGHAAAGGDPAPAGDPPGDDVRVLTLEVRSGAGLPAEGRFAARTGADPRDLYTMLAADPNDEAPGSGNAFRGSFDLHLAPGQHAWVRVVGSDGSVAFVAAGPLARNEIRQLQLGGPDRGSTIHAMVFAADGRSPAAGAVVQATFLDAASNQQRDLGRLVADRQGRLTVVDLPPGRCVLRADGFRPGDGPPTVASVVIPGGAPRRDAVATLVVPAPRVLVEIDALVQAFGPEAGAPRLLLRRVDREVGRLFHAAQPLHEGAQVAQLTVPEGDYEPLVVPEGELRVTGADGLLRVAAPGPVRFALHFAPAAVRTQLRLEGLAATDLPARVFLQAADGPGVGEPERFFGPPVWAAPAASVPVLPQPVQVVVQGRSGWFRSRDAVTLTAGAEPVAPLVPACRLTVRMLDWDPAADADALVVARVDGAIQTVPLRLGLIAAPAGQRLALVGEVALPRGRAVLECLRTSGEIVWRREVDASGAEVAVDVR